MLLLKSDGTLRAFGRFENMALGIVCNQEYRRGEIVVEPGDALIFYTDGVTEAMAPSRELFGRERLEKILKENAGQTAEELFY